MNFILLYVFSLLSIINGIIGQHPDEVLQVPGLKDEINFRHYSGYLNATDGRFLHYWFVESQNNPKEDPLILWLNGGPGCSSVLGFLTEQGPFHVNTDGDTLKVNPYSWNKVANVIFLEAPAGVGFSYKDDEIYDTDDDQTSLDNYSALEHFFIKFPQFKNHNFYVTGESYGGIYVPTLSVRILEQSTTINFKGYAVGNGYLDKTKLGNSLFYFGYYHGLIGTKVWENLVSACCNGDESRANCNFVNTTDPICLPAVDEARRIFSDPAFNMYNIYQDCTPSSGQNSHRSLSRESVSRKLLFQTLNMEHKLENLKEDPPCINDDFITKWLNKPEVRSALHIPHTVQRWEACSTAVAETYKNIYPNMKTQVLKLVQSRRLRGIIYNGDVDTACNFLGDEWFVNDLGLLVKQDFMVWHQNKQIAGFVKHFDGLIYTTVRGSGHMVPTDKPAVALTILKFLIGNATSLSSN